MSENLRLFAEFGENLALLIALTFLYSRITRQSINSRSTERSLIQGLLFGCIAILGMQLPIQVAEGVIVDGRIIIVLLASPFAGRLAGLITGLMVIGFRFHLGGIGMIAGIGAIATAMVVGMLFATKFDAEIRKIGVKQLLLMALVITPLSLLWIFALPSMEMALPILSKLLLPVSIMYPLATLLLGLMLAHEQERTSLLEALEAKEKKFRESIDSVPEILYRTDRHGRISFLSPSVEKLLGYTPDELLGKIAPEVVYADPDRWKEFLEKLKKDSQVLDFELPLKHKKGAVLWTSISAYFLTDSDSISQGVTGILRDIDRSKQAEQALLESEQQFRTIFEQAAVGVALVDSNSGHFLHINQCFCNMLGYTIAEMTGGKTFQEITHPDDITVGQAKMQQLLSGEIRDFTLVKRFHHKHGSIIWANLTVSATWNPGEKPEHQIAIVEEITGRVEERAEYRQILDTVNDGFLLIDTTGRLLDTNLAAARMLGYSRKEMLQLKIADIEAVASPGQAQQQFQNIIEQGNGTLESRQRRKDGSLIDVEINASYLPHGNGRFVAFLRDITERKLAEKTLNDSLAFLHLILDTNPHYIYWKDSDLVIRGGNRAFSLAAGLNDPTALIGKKDSDLSWSREEVEINRWDDRQLIKKGEPLLNMVRRQTKADGHSIIIESSKFPLRDSEGKTIGILSVGEDITERKRTEQALRRSQKMDAIGQLTGGIAHDFNNILGIVLGNVDLLKRQVPNDQVIQKRIDVIGKAAQRATDLTKQLLGFSRPQTTELVLSNLNHLIEGMGSLIARSVTPEVTVTRSFSDNLGLAEIDPGEFEDALLNLIINARDAMPDGGDLTLETFNCTLDAEYCSQNPGVIPGEYIQLAVSDNGTGIAREKQENIFEPFFTTKPQGKGTGLGLAMVFGFVKRSGGDIKVYSEPGIGTTFRIYLPRTAAEPQTAVAAAEPFETPIGGNETLLVVDDEEGLLELAKTTLEALGYRVFVASTANQALDILAREPDIALLFSDIVMPGGMNGYELAEQASHDRSELKVLLTSGYTEKAVAHNSQARFKANLLSKPYTQIQLAQQISALLGP